MNRGHWIAWVVGGALSAGVIIGCGSESGGGAEVGDADPITAPANVLIQADPGYDATTAADIVRAAPDRFLFRVLGPAAASAMAIADLVAFVDALDGWDGALVYSPDVTKADVGDWPGFDASAPHTVYVDYLATLNAALAGHAKQFAEIAIETEGSTIGSSPDELGALREYLQAQQMSEIAVGVVVGWTQIGAYAADVVDHTYIELYNIYALDASTDQMLVDGNQSQALCSSDGASGCSPSGSPGPYDPYSIYERMDPAMAAAQLVRILGLKWPTLPADVMPSTYFLLSYEPQFLGTDTQLWDLDAWNAIVADLRSGVADAEISTLPLLIGVYQSAPAFERWYGSD